MFRSSKSCVLGLFLLAVALTLPALTRPALASSPILSIASTASMREGPTIRHVRAVPAVRGDLYLAAALILSVDRAFTEACHPFVTPDGCRAYPLPPRRGVRGSGRTVAVGTVAVGTGTLRSTRRSDRYRPRRLI